MYHRGRTENISPFEIECANCRSHDVDVKMFRRNQFEIKCNKCGSYLNTNSYNELTFEDFRSSRNIGCGLITAMIAVVAVAVFVMIV